MYLHSLKRSNAKIWWHYIQELTGNVTSGGHKRDAFANKLPDGNKEELVNKTYTLLY